MVGKIPHASLAGLAELWEADEGIRRRFVFEAKLLTWSSPSATGIPTMTNAKLNYSVLQPMFNIWANACTSPRTPSLKAVRKEALYWVYELQRNRRVVLGCFDRYLWPRQVRKFWDLLNKPQNKIQIYCDAWGLRKLISQFIRRLPSKSRSPATGHISTIVLIHACTHISV